MQRSPSCSVTVTFRYNDFSVWSTTSPSALRAPSMAQAVAAINSKCSRSERIPWFPPDADSGEDRRNCCKRPDDLVDLQIKDQIERSGNGSRGAAESRNEVELAGVATAEPRLVHQQADRIR